MAQTGRHNVMGKQVEFSTRSARGRHILDGLEQETGMPPTVSSESRRVYDLGAGTPDADEFFAP